MQLKDVVNYPKTLGAEVKTRMSESAESRVTSLFENRRKPCKRSMS